jgi:tellurite resistance protein
MTLSTKEAVASLKILACVAMADGKIHDNERTALTVALEQFAEIDPEAAKEIQNVDRLLRVSAMNKVAEYAQVIFSADARELAYNTAFAMANVDGDCDPTEQEVLDTLQRVFEIKPRKVNNLVSVLKNMRQSFHRETPVTAEFDLAKREMAVEKLAMHYATLCSMFWVFPSLGVAIAPDILIFTYQCQMIREVAICWERDGAQVNAYDILKGIVGDTNLTGVRDTISNLTRMPPVGATMTGVAQTFANTWALTVAVNKYFAQLAAGGEVDMAVIQAEFENARVRGAEVYKENTNFVREKIGSLK